MLRWRGVDLVQTGGMTPAYEELGRGESSVTAMVSIITGRIPLCPIPMSPTQSHHKRIPPAVFD